MAPGLSQLNLSSPNLRAVRQQNAKTRTSTGNKNRRVSSAFPLWWLVHVYFSSPEDSRVVVLPPWPLLSPYHTEVTVVSQYNHILGSGEVLQRITQHGVCPGWPTPHRLGSGNQPSVKKQGWFLLVFVFWDRSMPGSSKSPASAESWDYRLVLLHPTKQVFNCLFAYGTEWILYRMPLGL